MADFVEKKRSAPMSPQIAPVHVHMDCFGVVGCVVGDRGGDDSEGIVGSRVAAGDDVAVVDARASLVQTWVGACTLGTMIRSVQSQPRRGLLLLHTRSWCWR